MNPFEILEVSPGASPEEIRAAYHRMARKWHPDRFTGEEKEEAEIRFREASEAFNALKDGSRRNSGWVRPSPPSESTPAQVAQPISQDRSAAEWFQEAQECMKAGDRERALGLIQVALRKDQARAEYHQLYGELLMQLGHNPRQAVKTFETVLRLKPNNTEAMRRLSELLTKLGMPQRAAALQQKANEISPEPKPIPKPKAADTRKKGPASKALPSMEGLGDQFKSLINKILKRG